MNKEIVDERKEIVDERIELKPNPQCKYCYGRGWLAFSVPDRYVGDIKEIRPCHCVKALAKEIPSSKNAVHYVLIPMLRDKE